MAHFRNTYKPARFFFMDIRVGVIVLASLMHVRTYTISIDVIAVALAWYVERLGMGIPQAVRSLRSWLAGPYRPAQQVFKVRQRVDFQYSRLPWQDEPFTGTVDLQPVIIERDANWRMISSKAEIVPPSKIAKKS